MSNKFKALRQKSGLTQQVLSEILKINVTTISKWENDEAFPRADKLPEIARIFNCSIDDLFCENETVGAL